MDETSYAVELRGESVEMTVRVGKEEWLFSFGRETAADLGRALVGLTTPAPPAWAYEDLDTIAKMVAEGRD